MDKAFDIASWSIGVYRGSIRDTILDQVFWGRHIGGCQVAGHQEDVWVCWVAGRNMAISVEHSSFPTASACFDCMIMAILKKNLTHCNAVYDCPRCRRSKWLVIGLRRPTCWRFVRELEKAWSGTMMPMSLECYATTGNPVVLNH